MTEPILVVDIGAATTAAAVVTQDHTALLRDPYTAANAWPSTLLLDDETLLVGTAAERRRRAAPRRHVDGFRAAFDARTPLRIDDRELDPADVMSGYIRALRIEAHRILDGPAPRLILTVPADYATPDERRDQLIAIGESAGFTEVELVDEAVAAALDPQSGGDLPDGALILVCDFGVTWSVALVQLRGAHPVQLAAHSMPAGRDLDARLLAGLRHAARSWLDPLLAAPGDAGLRAQQEAVDLIQRLKHRLADATEARDHLTPLTPAYRLTHTDLAAAAGPAVTDLLDACQRVIDAARITPADLSAVLAVGGAARLGTVTTALTDLLGHPVRRSAEPEFAVIRGAARWATEAPHRKLPADRPGWRAEAVVWELPDGQNRLLRWTVEDGQPYPEGSVLAEVRTADDRVISLTATRPGALDGHPPPPGSTLHGLLGVRVRRAAAALVADPPPLCWSRETTGSFLLSADRHVLLEADAAGRWVRSAVAATGEPLGVFAPEETARTTERGGRVFVDPDGRPVLVVWDAVAGCTLWDIESGKQTVRIRDVAVARRILVDESVWQLAVESSAGGAVGRYRRAPITLWDLRTGEQLSKTTDSGWEQRNPLFLARSTTDALTDSAQTPDGTLYAAAQPDGVLLTDPATGTELFRADAPAGASAAVAFDGDGRRMLICWEREGWSRIDVYDI